VFFLFYFLVLFCLLLVVTGGTTFSLIEETFIKCGLKELFFGNEHPASEYDLLHLLYL